MTEKTTTHTHSINYDNLTRVLKPDVSILYICRRGKKVYSYDFGDEVLYLTARDYEHAKEQLRLLFTNTHLTNEKIIL
jgi:hypothetical protein